MAILVTGCAGFIGSCLCETLLARGDKVIGIDAFTDYYAPSMKRDNLKALEQDERFRLIEACLVKDDLRPVLEEVECIFHTAGQPGVRGSWGEQFDLYVRNNILATQRLLEQIKAIGKEIKLIYSSSSSIYGNTQELPTPETALPKPYSPYGTTKLAAEHLCFLYHANYGLPVVALRYFTVYGPRQRPDMAFHLFMNKLLNKEPIVVLGDGKQTRDFTYVGDIVQANLAAAERPVEGEIFNIGGGSRIALRDVLTILANVTGITPTIEYKAPTKGDVRDTSACTDRARERLDYQPQTTLEEGLRQQFLWHQSVFVPSE